MADSECTICHIVNIALCVLQNLAEDKGRPKIVPSLASIDTVSSLKSPPPIINHFGHSEYEAKPENHTVSTKVTLIMCNFYLFFQKIIYFLHLSK
jgi:hypothetical protein